MRFHLCKISVLFFLSVYYANGYSQKTYNYLFKEHPIHFEDPAIKEWASECRIIRGYIRIDDKELGKATAGEDNACLGKADNITVSLGDSGIAVVAFREPVKNIDGYDFAVFENSFDGQFLELAFVEVSSDSTKWVRFPSISLTPADIQTNTFGLTDPEKVHNLAGKYRAYYGTPFDIDELRDSAGIDLNNIKYVKIIDVIGSIDDRYASYDTRGNKINDPWPTPFPQSGFDLDAVAVLKQVTGIRNTEADQLIRIYPNPSSERINIDFKTSAFCDLTIVDNTGKILKKYHLDNLDNGINNIGIEDIKPGIYFVIITGDKKQYVTRLIIY